MMLKHRRRVGTILVVLATSLLYFHRVERTLADRL